MSADTSSDAASAATTNTLPPQQPIPSEHSEQQQGQPIPDQFPYTKWALYSSSTEPRSPSPATVQQQFVAPTSANTPGLEEDDDVKVKPNPGRFPFNPAVNDKLYWWYSFFIFACVE